MYKQLLAKSLSVTVDFGWVSITQGYNCEEGAYPSQPFLLGRESCRIEPSRSSPLLTALMFVGDRF